MANGYADLLIRIMPKGENEETYPLEARDGDDRLYRDGELRLDHDVLLQAALNPREYGQQLCKALFVEPIERAYQNVVGRVRIRLEIDRDADELHAIAWERLFREEVPLAASRDTPFSRYFSLEKGEYGPLTQRPVKMLVVVANPPDLEDGHGLNPIEVEAEIDNLHQALGDLDQLGHTMQVTLMPGRTGLSERKRRALEEAGYRIQDGPSSLANILEHVTEAHILHFVGHGTFSQKAAARGTAALLLEDDAGEGSHLVKDDDFVDRLTPLSARPRLIFLVACESAKPGDRGEATPGTPFGGLGPKLVQAGIPAVVAMQEMIEVGAAQTLTRDFYRRLPEHGVVDQALNDARSRVYANHPERTDWSTPVLFQRLVNGELFAPDPVWMALHRIRDHQDYALFAEGGGYIPLPVEVIKLTGQQYAQGLERVELDSTARQGIDEAFRTLFSRRPYPSRSRNISPRLILLVGGAGSNRTTQLKRLVWETAGGSLKPDARRQVLPIFVNLSGYPDVRAKYDPIKILVQKALREFWPDLTVEDFDQLLTQGPVLRILFHGMDDLPEREQRPAWEQIQELIRRNPQHDYVLATDMRFALTSSGEIRDLDSDLRPGLRLLLLQPLALGRLRHLADELAADDPRIQKLVAKLDQSQLYDLVETPWFLVRMIQRARDGDYPESRTQVLQRLVEDEITKIPAKEGMRAHAEDTVYSLAWEMQSAGEAIWPASEAFRIMAEVRGKREYNLEEFYDALTGTILLDRVGEDELRFTYLPVQAYCCARAIMNMPNRDKVLDDITATLGRITRLRWWEETLVFLSGLMADEPDALTDLLHKIIYGVNLLEGEQTFLAALCLLESQQAGEKDDPELIEQVADALIWRLNREHEPRITHRVRAARLLSQLVYPLASGRVHCEDEQSPEADQRTSQICCTVVNHLTSVANRKARRNNSGQRDFYYSSLRLAAAKALQHLYPQLEREVEAVDPELDRVLHMWQDKRVNDLIDEVQTGDQQTQAIAVLALGDVYDYATLRAKMGKDQDLPGRIIDCLVDAFLDPETDQVVRWALADALATVDTSVVNRRVIRELLEGGAGAKFDTEKKRVQLYKCLAYLIGRVRSEEETARRFLSDTCLGEYDDVRLWASAIRAMGELSDPQHKELLEQIAVGDLGGFELRGNSARDLSAILSEADEPLLRRRAIQALANVGDNGTLSKLRASQTYLDMELWRTFYQTSEEIYWRMSQRESL